MKRYAKKMISTVLIAALLSMSIMQIGAAATEDSNDDKDVSDVTDEVAEDEPEVELPENSDPKEDPGDDSSEVPVLPADPVPDEADSKDEGHSPGEPEGPQIYLLDLFTSRGLAYIVAQQLCADGFMTETQLDHWETQLVELENLRKVTTVNQFNASNMDGSIKVTSLKGLEYCSNLKELALSPYHGNMINDLAPLEKLTSLESITILLNGIEDVSPLKDLVNLKVLNLDANQIKDISALAGLENLERLSLDRNSIKDISVLAEMTNLKSYNIYSQFIYMEAETEAGGQSLKVQIPVVGIDGSAAGIEVRDIYPAGNYDEVTGIVTITDLDSDGSGHFYFGDEPSYMTPYSLESSDDMNVLSGATESGFGGMVIVNDPEEQYPTWLVSEDGIIVVGEFEEGTEFITKKVTAGTEHDLLMDGMKKDNTDREVYEMYLLLDGERVQPLSEVEVYLPIRDEYIKNARIYRLEADKSIIELETEAEDEFLMFVTDHFSYYGIGDGVAPLVEKTPEEPCQTTPPAKTKAPKTGDYENMVLWLSAAAICLIFMTATARKNNVIKKQE